MADHMEAGISLNNRAKRAENKSFQNFIQITSVSTSSIVIYNTCMGLHSLTYQNSKLLPKDLGLDDLQSYRSRGVTDRKYWIFRNLFTEVKYIIIKY